MARQSRQFAETSAGVAGIVAVGVIAHKRRRRAAVSEVTTAPAALEPRALTSWLAQPLPKRVSQRMGQSGRI
jgi:hypothetical protein